MVVTSALPLKKKVADQMVQIDRNSRVLFVRDFGCLNEAEPIVFDSLHPVQQYEGRIYHRFHGNLEYIGQAFRHEHDQVLPRDDFMEIISSLRAEDYLVLRGVHSPRRWKHVRPRNFRYTGEAHG